MNSHATINAAVAAPMLTKTDPAVPALIVTGPQSIAIRAGAVVRGRTFEMQTPINLTSTALNPGTDYVVIVDADRVEVQALNGLPDGHLVLGGFHYAPGGNAAARKGGDEIPAINPYSLWDLNFRPACADPRGMALVDGPRGKFWCDIYLLGIHHLTDGTSRFGAIIADGNDRPQNPDGGKFKKLDYATAVAVLAHHGKQVLALDEFFAAAYGVTEKTVHDGDPSVAKLDAPRTSKFGVMQATGNLWVWGHDGDPDQPRCAILGGSWWNDGYAGSRCAYVGRWPVHSAGDLGARGRSDHLQLA